MNLNSIVAAGLALASAPGIKNVLTNLENDAAGALAADVNKLVTNDAERQAGAQLAGGLKIFFTAVETALAGPAPVAAVSEPAPEAATVHETSHIPSTVIDGAQQTAEAASAA